MCYSYLKLIFFAQGVSGDSYTKKTKMNLDFDDSIRMHPGVRRQERDKIRRLFIKHVDRKLALHREDPLNRLSIKCKDDVGPSPVIRWISKVLNRHVTELVLHISSHWSWPLSSEVDSSETMCQEFWEFCSVSSTTLKRLTFRFKQMFDENPKSVSFDTPNLVYFEYSDAIADTYPKVDFASLVEASLDLRMTHEQICKAKFSEDDLFKEEEGTMVGNATALLMGICNVKKLYLSDNTLEVSSVSKNLLWFQVSDVLLKMVVFCFFFLGSGSCFLLQTNAGLRQPGSSNCQDRPRCRMGITDRASQELSKS